MNPYTDLQIKALYEAGEQDVESLIAPLKELAAESSTLILGYGLGQAGIREETIPYFHVCGTKSAEEPVRALLVGGWAGTETVTTLAIARLLAAMEARMQLAEGIEVTAFPVANLDAHRQKSYLSNEQTMPDVRCWEESPCSHIQVLEKELGRYAYDVVILLRQNPRSIEPEVEAWLTTDQQKTVISSALKRHASVAPNFRWKPNPVRPTYKRTFTPMPEREKQPAEIIVALPGAMSATEQSNEALGIILGLLHSVRQARQEGLL